MLKRKGLLLGGLLAMSTGANAGYTFNLNDNDSLTFGGYIKVDARYVDGDVGYRDFWIGGGAIGDNASQIKIFANETRFNTKYVHGDVTGFIEMDFYSGGGNEIISNSYNPRLRHAFIQYKDVLMGQTWSTFMNTTTFAETADFGGAHVAEAFIRQGQIRYTLGDFQLALENPESYKGDATQDSIPDFIAKYTLKGDWGNVSVAGLARQLNTTGLDKEAAFGGSIAGKISTFGKDDLRFQFAGGNVGRYVGTTAIPDLVDEEVEKSISIMTAYRHFWTETARSSLFFGKTTTDLSDHDRTHWGLNVFKNYTKELSFGLEAGQYIVDDQDAESLYVQLSAKYVL